MQRSATFLLAALATQLLVASPVAATVVPITTVVAVEGDPAPDGNGSLLLIQFAVLNEGGQAAFFSSLTGTSGGSGASDTIGIFRGDGATLTQIVRGGQAAPDGNGSFSALSAALLNDSGEATFHAILSGTSSGTDDDRGIFRGNGTALTQIAREGEAAPDGNGYFSSLGNHSLNNSGQVAFRADLIETSGGPFVDDSGIFRANGATSTQIVRRGDAAPDGNGSFISLSDPSLNDSGEVAFSAFLSGTSGGTSDDSGVFRGNGVTLTQIARQGDAAPDGNGLMGELTPSAGFETALNSSGQVAFTAGLTGTSGGASDNSGVFRGDGTTLTQIAREGDAAPDGNGSLASLVFDVALSDSGQALFVANLTGTSGGSSDDQGVFRGDGSTLTQIAREGDAAPDGNGTFSSFFATMLNGSGQVVFQANLTGTSGGEFVDDVGIYFYDDVLGLFQVARRGDAFLGSTIVGLGPDFSADVQRGDEGSGLNNLGKVAYRFSLADGRDGIALWMLPMSQAGVIPEPSTFTLAALALFSLGLCRNGRR